MRELNEKIIYEGNMEGRMCEGFSLQFYQDGPKKVLLFEMPMLLKFKILLIYMAEGPGIHDHVIRDICTEGTQLWQFNMGTHLANWPCLEVQGVISFYGHSKCASLHNGGVILLLDDA
jgi:hypothetical protein